MNRSNRILSIDIFRGLIIFLMVFVNDLAGVSDIPAWMKHVPADFDGMTFVDVVFPAFLFIVGMAVPFAVNNRLERNPDLFSFWKHVLVRTAGLLILGVYMVNSAEMNRDANLIPHWLWAGSLYIAVVLIWNRYPEVDDSGKRRKYAVLRTAGFLTLAALYFLYRKGLDDVLTGMTPSWWGILGLIGWAYLVAMVFYMIAGGRVAMFGFLSVLFAALFILLRWEGAGELTWLGWLKGQTGHMSHSTLVMAGIFSSMILSNGGVREAAYRKMALLALFAVAAALVAFAVRPVTGGVSKIGATPAWTFYCISICIGVYLLVYWLVDLLGKRTWAAFLKPAGQNPLLTYILPPFYYALAGFSLWPAYLNAGMPGFFRSVVFSLLILWVAGLLTKRGVKLHL